MPLTATLKVLFGRYVWGRHLREQSLPIETAFTAKKSKCRFIVSAANSVHERENWIDGRWRQRSRSLGSTQTRRAGATTGNRLAAHSRRSSGRPEAARVIVAVAGLAIAFLLGVFFVSYGSKLYENWHEHRLLLRATTLLTGGRAQQSSANGARNSLAGIRILSQHCPSWQTQRKDKILKRPLHGASASHVAAKRS